jgi:hypothetical protein
MSRLKAVTQLTSKTTDVTMNAKNGIITTVALTDAADTEFEFVVSNNKVYPDSNIQATAVYGGAGVPLVSIVSRDKFTFTLRIANVGVAAFDAAVGINVSIVG